MDHDAGLHRVAERYHFLRGLLLLPAGVVLVAAGVTGVPPIGPEPVPAGLGAFVAVAVVALVGYAVIHHHYVLTFGRTEPTRSARSRIGLLAGVHAVAITLGMSIDSQAELAVSAFGLAFAAGWLLHYRVLVGLRAYHWVALGSLAVLSALPIWDVERKVSLAMLPLGIATIVVGLLDHRELVRSIRVARTAIRPVDVDA